jgi:hypothetical protein
MTLLWTSDGWGGGVDLVTSDGWPTQLAPVTSDGWLGGGGGGGSVGVPQGGGGGGGGFHRKRRKHRPFYRLDDILSGKAAIMAREAYEELHASDKAEQAGEIVRSFAKSEAAVPSEPAIDWAALHADADATRRLMKLWHQHQIELDDEDFLRMLD